VTTRDARRWAFTDLDGHILRKFDLPPGKIHWAGATWTLQWTPDAKGLVIGMEWADVINLWYQPVSGGKPRQVTHFPDSVMRAAWSPDGKRIALMRHSASSDAILFRNFR
jgi:Tol biopolymer transport system component